MLGKKQSLDALKQRLLRHKAIAVLVLIFISFGAFLTQSKQLLEFIKLVKPYMAIIIQADAREYEVTAYESLSLKLNVVMVSEKPIILNDVKIHLVFLKFNEETNSFEPIAADELEKYFSMKDSEVRIPPLDSQHNWQKVEITFGCPIPGRYSVHIKGESKTRRLESEENVVIIVRKLDPKLVGSGEGLTIPTFIAMKNLLNVSPKFFEDLNEFRMIHYEEAERTNIGKARLDFSADYAGAVGHGYVISVPRNRYSEVILKAQEETFLENKAMLSPIYYQQNSALVEIDFFPVYGKLVVPIGMSLYELEMLDSQRIKCVKVSTEKFSFLQSINGKYEGTVEGKISKYNIPYEFEQSYGATGRVSYNMLRIGDDRFERKKGSDLGDNEENFPLFVVLKKIRKGDPAVPDLIGFLRIEFVGDISLRVSEYRFAN